MLLQGLGIALTVVSGVIGILIAEKTPLRVKLVLVVLALLGASVAFATSYHDAQEAMKTSYALGQMVKNAPTPPNFNNDLHNAIHFVVADHDLFPLNEPKADSSGWAREYDYTSPVSLLKQAQSGSVTDVIVMDDEDRLNFKADYVTNGGSEQPENSMAALSCGIRHTFFQEPCFKSQFIRTTTAWFWTPRTRITYYDYMLHHFCMIAEELNPNAKNIVIELTTGDKQHQLRSEGCGIDLDTIKNGQVPTPLKLTLGADVIGRVFEDRPSRFYAVVYNQFKKQSEEVARQKP